MTTPASYPETPKVQILDAFAVSAASARAERFAYEKLVPEIDLQRPYESVRWRQFLDADAGGIDEKSAAEKLASYYIMLGAEVLGRTNEPALWSERFTESSIALYGQPDPELARRLQADRDAGIEASRLPFHAAGEVMREYLYEKYAQVFAALEIEVTSTEMINPVGIADRFEAGIKVLAEHYDPEWQNWTVERNPEKDMLNVTAPEKKIVVGMKRAGVRHTQLRELFTHEALVHAQRSINGSKRSAKLGVGLPGYMDAEEGLGVFMEYALSGVAPEKNVDRYLDIAFALGQLDGEPHVRQELVAHAYSRAIERNARAEVPKSEATLLQEVYAHVNRIYRGSRGDNYIGVFTKDITYHKGFVEMGEYVQARLDAGESIGDIFEHLMQGKFDPTNPAHEMYLADHPPVLLKSTL